MDTLVLLAVLAAAVFFQSFLLRHFGMRGITYHRAFSRRTAFEGETVELVEVIQNRKLLLMPWLRMESRVSPYLSFNTKEELEIRGQRYHKSVFCLAPFSRVTRRHKVRLDKRGVYDLSAASMTYGDFMGLAREVKDLNTGAAITVYPRLLSDDEARELPSSRWQGELIVKRWIVSDPFLMSGIRPYRAGDSPRDIHWPATARMGEMQVKTHEYTADPKLFVILNCEKAEKQWGDLMEYEQGFVEYGIRLTATLCAQALRGGVEAGFAANMPIEENGPCAVLPPLKHASREEEIFDALARLRVTRVKRFPTFLDELGALTGLDILILTKYVSDEIETRVSMLRLMGNTVSIRMLEEDAA